MSLYVCLGTPAHHLSHLEELAAEGGKTNWTVNSKAEVGDEVLFYLTAPVSALVARGTVASRPERDDDPSSDWFGHYMADIDAVSALLRPIHIRELRAGFPEWRWLASPIKSSRVPDGVVAPLSSLLALAESATGTKDVPDVDEEAIEATEGRAQWVRHLRRERSSKLVGRKRAAVVRETGALACEVCRFDFAAKYGTIGTGFCEVHHLVPLADVLPGTKTRLADLAVLCSKCHRVIRRTKPMLTPAQLTLHLLSGA